MAGVHLLDRKHYLYHYDIQYFAMTCLRDTELNLCQQYYAADIIAKIVGMDGRLCLALARQDLYFHPEKCHARAKSIGRLGANPPGNTDAARLTYS